MTIETIRQGRSLYVFGVTDAGAALSAAEEAGMTDFARVNREQLLLNTLGEVVFADGARGRPGYRFSDVVMGADRTIRHEEESNG